MLRTSALIVLSSSTVAVAQVTDFVAMIDSAQQVPANMSPATGMLSGRYDAAANTFAFSWDISSNLIGTPSNPGAHLHNAAAGSNGPVVFAFNNPDGSWALSGAATWTGLTMADVDALFAGEIYANFHTTSFPGGEVRGQLMVVPAPATAGVLALGGLALSRRRR